MKKTKVYRHGEIAFEVIKDLPANLVPEDTKTFLKGSHGNPHSFIGGVFYRKETLPHIIGYFKAENTTLTHSEHGHGTRELKEANLPDGVYCVRRAVEIINKEMKPVID